MGMTASISKTITLTHTHEHLNMYRKDFEKNCYNLKSHKYLINCNAHVELLASAFVHQNIMLSHGKIFDSGDGIVFGCYFRGVCEIQGL